MAPRSVADVSVGTDIPGSPGTPLSPRNSASFARTTARGTVKRAKTMKVAPKDASGMAIGGKHVKLPQNFEIYDRADMHPLITGYERSVLHHNDLSDADFEALRHLMQALYDRLIEKGLVQSTDTKIFNHPLGQVLYRYLRARKFDLDMSTTMITNTFEWRESYGTNTIISDFDFTERDQVKQYYPTGYIKGAFDPLGRPVYVERVGEINLKKIIEVGTPERLARSHIQEYELLMKHRMPELSAQRGYTIDQTLSIFDLKGLKFSTFNKITRDFFKTVSKMDADNYPEMLGKLYIVNAPSFFRTIWSLVSGLIDPRTRDKITILGANFHAKLHEAVDPQCLPVRYGGPKSDHDCWEHLYEQYYPVELQLQKLKEKGEKDSFSFGAAPSTSVAPDEDSFMTPYNSDAEEDAVTPVLKAVTIPEANKAAGIDSNGTTDVLQRLSHLEARMSEIEAVVGLKASAKPSSISKRMDQVERDVQALSNKAASSAGCCRCVIC
mmetsp:Transcript_10363/g.38221  ORF Transcript_10363/g.38221 Transcript_10363/m.38221 type:complete len:496 (-) Transcript_10363:681-2168(-)